MQRTKVLRWGGDMQGGPPYVYEDESGRLVGFEVEIADAIARELGVRAQFVHAEWASLVAELERGSFEMAMNGLEVIPSRADRVLFTRPYYIFSERLMAQRRDPSITGLASLDGKRVGTLTNSQAAEMLEAAGAEVVPYDGTDTPYLDLARGRLDAVLLDDIIAAGFGEPNPRLRVVGDVGDGYYAIAFRRSDRRLRTEVDRALTKIARSGELRRILANHELDGARQARLERWTAEDTRTLMRSTERPHFSMRHVVLFLKGAGVTLLVSVLAFVIAVVVGLLLALLRQWGPRPLAALGTLYVEVIRGTPVLLQLYLLYFGLAEWISLGPLTAAVIGLGLNYAAYEAEVYRGGFAAVPPGQLEAAQALGMSTPLALRRVLAPQALRVALPSMTNDFIALLKDSALVSVIAVIELTKRMTIVAVELRSWLIPAAMCALLYLLMSWPLSILARRLEAKVARG